MTFLRAAQVITAIADVRLSFAYSVGYYALAVIIAVVFAFFVYRFTLPPVSRLRKTILWTLRTTALLLLIFLLFEPFFVYHLGTEKPPVIAVLADRSASMGVSVKGEDRAQVLRDFVAGSSIKGLEKKARIRVFSFADSVSAIPLDSIAALTLTGVGSDISGAWMHAQKMLSAENLAAIVLISDGAYNLGENPVRTAAALPVPVFAIGIGDTAGEADAYIAEITTNELTYAGSRVPVDVRIHARGLNGAASVVRLLGANGVELAQQSVHFSGEESELSISLGFEAHEPGDLRLTAVLDSVKGESALNNNRRSVIVRVLERKARIFLIASSPSADLTILRQTLESDTTAEITALIEVGTGRYVYGMPEPTTDDLANSSVIVLCDFPSSRSSSSLVNAIQQAAVSRRIPVLFLAGPHVSTAKLSTLKSVLPLETPRALLTEEVVLTRGAASHPALSGAAPLPAEWSELPPVYGGVGNFSVSGGGHVAVKLSREALGITEDEPGLVMWEAAGRRSAAVLCWGTARWKLQLAGNQSQAAFYDQVISRLRGWLIAPAEEQRVKIRASKKLYSGGEPARFSAQVYGANLEPRDDASIDLRVTSGTRTENVALRSRGSGRYEGELSPWAFGEYRFSGTAAAGGDTLGIDRGLFAVEPFNIDLLDPRARFDVLRSIAHESGGSFAPAAQADTMLARLAFNPQTVVTRHEVSLWRQGPIIWIIIALLALEWFIRKRSGML
jgi:hypothetical protein